MATINTSAQRKQMVKIYCTESGKTLDAELIRTDKDKITVILPGFIKMMLYKDPKPHFYVAHQGGLEFTCDTSKK